MRHILMVMLIMFFLVGLTAMAQAADLVRWTWTANTEADLAGYRLYWCIADPDPLTCTKATGALVADLANPAQTSHDGTADLGEIFFLTAYDTSGNESGESNRVVWNGQDTLPPANPSGLSMTAR